MSFSTQELTDIVLLYGECNLQVNHAASIHYGERFGLAASKLGLAHILSEFEVQTCERTPTVVKYDNRGFTLVPTNKIYVKFVKLPIPAA